MENPSIKYRAVKNEEVAEALMEMALPLLKTAGSDKGLIESLIEITVKAWNLSLFPPLAAETAYDSETEAVIPENMPEAKRTLFKNFMKFLIAEKQRKYPDYMKGIRKYEYREENDKISLIVDALPVKPFKTR